MGEKVVTGITGLDKALNGGFPRGSIILLSGGAGTGKSTLAMQYLIEGAKKGEKGLYISTEQNERELHKMGKGFGWDLEGLQKKQFLYIKHFDVVKSDNFLERIYELYTDFQPKRIVIDSLTTLTDAMFISDMKDDSSFSMAQVIESVSPIPKTERIIGKTMMYHLIGKLKLFDATVILTSELQEGTEALSADGISEFICDGVCVLHYLGIIGGSNSRTLQIRKMRYTDHNKSYLPYEIKSKKGLLVHEDEAMDVLMK